DTGEHATRAAPRKHLSGELCVSLRGRLAAHRARRDFTLATQCELALHQPLRAAIIHHEQHNVGFRSADLESKAAAFHTNSGGRMEAAIARATASHKALTEFAADDESALL